MKKTAIYALCDPITHQVRYIGQSVRPHVRYWEHNAPQFLIGKTHKINWLKKLHREGLMPELVILDWVDSRQSDEAEIAWIRELRKAGVPLTNGTDGGKNPVKKSSPTSYVPNIKQLRLL